MSIGLRLLKNSKFSATTPSKEERLDWYENEDEVHEAQIGERKVLEVVDEPLGKGHACHLVRSLGLFVRSSPPFSGRFTLSLLDRRTRHDEPEEYDLEHRHSDIEPKDPRDADRLAEWRRYDARQESAQIHEGIEHRIAHRGGLRPGEHLDTGIERRLIDAVSEYDEEDAEKRDPVGARPRTRFSELRRYGNHGAADRHEGERNEKRFTDADPVDGRAEEHHCDGDARGEDADGAPRRRIVEPHRLVEEDGEQGEHAEVGQPFEHACEVDAEQRTRGFPKVNERLHEFSYDFLESAGRSLLGHGSLL